MPYGSLAAKLAAERYDELYNKFRGVDVIDAHSHFGNDKFWVHEGDVDYYVQKAKEHGIGATLAMPVPSPVFKEGDREETLSYYEVENGEIKHYHVEKRPDKEIWIPHLQGTNPYKKANDAIYKMCQERKDFQFEYVPLLHPNYYSEEDIAENVQRGANIFKIHGIACGIDPQEIDPEFFHLLEKYRAKLIIHTDYSSKDDLASRNSAMNWIKVLEKYHIKAYLAHAARLDPEAIDIINHDYRFIVGLGPDRYLGNCGLNYQRPDDILQTIFDSFEPSKVVFDIDYPWNIRGINREIKNIDLGMDWRTVERLDKYLGPEEKEKVLKRNIINFMF